MTRILSVADGMVEQAMIQVFVNLAGNAGFLHRSRYRIKDKQYSFFLHDLFIVFGGVICLQKYKKTAIDFDLDKYFLTFW